MKSPLSSACDTYWSSSGSELTITTGPVKNAGSVYTLSGGFDESDIESVLKGYLDEGGDGTMLDGKCVCCPHFWSEHDSATDPAPCVMPFCPCTGYKEDTEATPAARSRPAPATPAPGRTWPALTTVAAERQCYTCCAPTHCLHHRAADDPGTPACWACLRDHFGLGPDAVRDALKKT